MPASELVEVERILFLLVHGVTPGRFEAVVRAVEAFTPRMEVVSPGRLMFAMRGPARYWGGEEELARKVRSAVGDALSCQIVRHQEVEKGGGAHRDEIDIGPERAGVGVAGGSFAAELAALKAIENGGESSILIPESEIEAFLAPFPIGVLQQPELVGVLLRLGIETLGDIVALGRAPMLERFGEQGRASWLLASGQKAHSLLYEVADPQLEVVAEVDPPAAQVEAAAFVARSAAERLGSQLSRSGLACTRLTLTVETEHGEVHTRCWYDRNSFTPAMVVDRLRWQVEGWISGDESNRPTGGVALLRLVPEEVVRVVAAPSLLGGSSLRGWGGAGREPDERASRAVARLQGLLGPGAVRVPHRQGGRSPQDEFKWISWGQQETRKPWAPWPGRLPSPSPAVIHDPPVPTEVMDRTGRRIRVSARGEMTGRPHQMVVGEARIRIDQWAGPWLLDERWWDEETRRRQARFQFVDQYGRAFLVVLESGVWSIAAAYD